MIKKNMKNMKLKMMMNNISIEYIKLIMYQHASFNTYLDSVDADGDADHVYLNLNVVNNTSSQTGADPRFNYRETRDSPIIEDSSKYELSIVRSTINGAGVDLPIFVPQIGIGVTTINKSIYSFTFDCGVTYGVTGNTTLTSDQTFMDWSPENINATTPKTPLVKQDLETDYYFAYTYNHVTDLLNTTIDTAFSSLNTKFGTWGEGSEELVTKAPRIQYDATTEKFSIYADKNGFGEDNARVSAGTTGDENITMYMNSNMYNLFSSFQTTDSGSDASVGKNHKIIVKQKPVDNTQEYNISYGVTASGWEVLQDYVSTSHFWTPVDAIVFATTLLPIKSENIGPSFNLGTNNLSTNTDNAFYPIITDVSLPLGNADGYRHFIEYAPSAEYRMITLSPSKQTINSIDIQLYWRNRLDNQLYPLQMPNMSSVNCKLLFRRRGVSD